MPGIVSENHWVERRCAEIRMEIRRRYQAELEHPDEAVRKKAEDLVNREIQQAITAYLKTTRRRSLPHGTILH
jgi:hypothetical protein